MERLSEGRHKSETLAQVQEEVRQEKSKPESSRQWGIHLDSTLTVQTKKRSLSKMLRSVAELRTKYTVMKNIWLMAQMRHPGRALFADVDWNSCLKYEFQLRKQALKVVREVGMQAALWAACRDPQHRMRNWMKLLTVADAKDESKESETVHLLLKRVAQLKRSLQSAGKKPKLANISAADTLETEILAKVMQPRK